MKKLTDLQYNVLMQAINNAKNACDDGEFIDPYDNEEQITHEECKLALLQAEVELIKNQLGN